jgi:hypothetical protein
MNSTNPPLTPDEIRAVNIELARDGVGKFEIPSDEPSLAGTPPGKPILEIQDTDQKLSVKDNSNNRGIFSNSPFHYHDGVDQPLVNLNYISGFIQTITVSPPPYVPRNFFEQFVIVNNGGTYEVWIFTVPTATWIKIY